MNPHDHPGLIYLIQLCLTDKITAIHKRNSKTLPIIFCGSMVAEDHCRIVMVAGDPSLALHRLDPVVKRLTLRKTFHGMSPVKMDHIHRAFGEIQFRRHDSS